MKADKTVLQMKYARIVDLFAKQANMTLEDALSFFYGSTTYELISEGVADMHCRSDEYLADELIIEYKEKVGNQYSSPLTSYISHLLPVPVACNCFISYKLDGLCKIT